MPPHIGCAQRHETSFLLFILLPVLAIAVNFFVLFAVLRSYRKLVRRTHVYVHVCSNLCANLVFALLALIQVSDGSNLSNSNLNCVPSKK